MEQYLINIDATKCTGCRLCEMACSLHNGGACDSTRSRIRVIQDEAEGVVYAVPVLCQQCEKPICMDVCPTGAIDVDQRTGAKVVNEGKCVGCKRCMYVCPIGAVGLDTKTGVAVKCDLCGGDPWCVKICPTGALQYVRADMVDWTRRREHVKDYLDFQAIGTAR